MLVCGQELTSENLESIRVEIARDPGISRVALSKQICGQLGWRDSAGQLKDVACRVALLKLERSGKIRLPPAGKRPPGRRERGNAWETLEIKSFSDELAKLGTVELVRVDSAECKASRLWNELMDRYHPLGCGPLCGAQMRYLIFSSEAGWLGGFAFSAAAYRLKARDQWIGWSEEQRRQNLGQVVCNSRFLICPEIRVPNLASHVLSLCARRIKSDWRNRYGYEPVLLETFVEKDRFRGSSYRAANWTHVGSSQGRGRQDRHRTQRFAVKDIYLYALIPEARKRLCEATRQPEVSTAQEEPREWSEEEFGSAPLGDERLNKRLLKIARDFYARPQAQIPQASQSRAKAKAAYRFFDHAEVTMEKILEPHYRSTEKRVRAEEIVLAVQDTTSLNYTAHPATEGLGPMSSSKKSWGLELHSTLTFNLEGTPLGFLDVQCWARDPEDFGNKEQRHELPIEQKESYKWLLSFEKVAEVQQRCPKTTLVSVGDREADIYELFKLAWDNPKGPKLLVRAKNNRALVEEQGLLWDQIAQEPLRGIHGVQVPRQGSRPKRQAELEVRFARVTLRPPKSKPKLGELSIYAILAEEKNAPAGVEPLKWMLLTTLEVKSFQEATEKLMWYAKRWGIEVFHRTLKSGCKIEERQLGDASRIENCLAIDMVVAWRIFRLSKLGRETPDVPCSVYFEEAEWKALFSFVRKQPAPPENPPPLREAMHLVASLGGFLGRKGDGDPGTKALWLGLQRLDDIAAAWEFAVRQYAPHLLSPSVSSNPGYG